MLLNQLAVVRPSGKPLSAYAEAWLQPATPPAVLSSHPPTKHATNRKASKPKMNVHVPLVFSFLPPPFASLPLCTFVLPHGLAAPFVELAAAEQRTADPSKTHQTLLHLSKLR